MANTYTNTTGHGNEFLRVVHRELTTAQNIVIASGYVSLDIVEDFHGDFRRIASSGGKAQLMVGMAFYEGLPSRKLLKLQEISQELNSLQNESGVFVSYSRKYHGKVYSFNRNLDNQSTYVGSSNFSRSGLSQNIETTIKITDPTTDSETLSFLDFLMGTDNAVLITNADIAKRGSAELRQKLVLNYLSDLERYEPNEITPSLPRLNSFEFDLRKAVLNEKSNLNVYFGKGRLARATGKVKPRPWYEVEFIAPRELNAQDIYPKGDFLAYTDDGYIIPMKTSGDFYKNIRSRHSLQLLGQWIKGKLQANGALVPLTPVTEDTLDEYGNDKITFHRIDDDKYYMSF